MPIVQFGVRSFASPRALVEGLRLARFIRSRKIDIVHSFDVPLNVFAVPFAKFAGAPVVLSSQRAHRDLTSQAYRQLMRIGDQLVDGIVVNCDYMRRHLVEDEHVPGERIHLCYNGMNLDKFNADGRRTNEIPVIGVVCALRPEKDLSTLLGAFAAVHAERAVRLRIVGSGPEEERLKELATQLGIGDATEFIPTQPEVAGYLREIDIFVLPSRTEALSNALMEAMACGCACVASNVGGNPELVGNSRGLLFESGNVGELSGCLKTLIDDPGLRSRVSHAAREFTTEHFTIAASAARMAQIYRSMFQ